MKEPRILMFGDCLERMGHMDADSVDAIVTDPPYGITSLDWDSADYCWIWEAGKVLKPSGSLWVFGSFRSLVPVHKGFIERGWKFSQEVVWEKHNGSSFHADRFRRVHELVAQFYRGRWSGIYKMPQFTQDATARTVRTKSRPPHMGQIERTPYVSEDGGPRLMRSVLRIKSCHHEAEHPTQKPVELIRPLIRYSVPPGGIVFDPFMGSGTTGIAAHMEGCRFIGIEKEREYFDIATSRIDECTRQEALPL